MQPVRLLFALIASLVLSATAQAAPITLEPVQIGENLAEKTEEYGARDVERLIDELTEAVTRRLERDGHDVVMDAGAIRVAITLEDAWPNRPTSEQLGDRPGLSLRSLSLGGARVSATLYDAAGSQIGEINYSWRTHDISDSVGRATWTDAERTFDRFARNLSAELSRSAS